MCGNSWKPCYALADIRIPDPLWRNTYGRSLAFLVHARQISTLPVPPDAQNACDLSANANLSKCQHKIL